jgi:hypothetical protein
MEGTSIKDQIRSATTVSQLEQIMRKAASYEHAAEKTKRQWKRLSDQKRKEVTA